MDLERFETSVIFAWAVALSMVICCTGVLLTFPQDAEPWCAALWLSVAVAWGAAIACVVVRRRLRTMP